MRDQHLLYIDHAGLESTFTIRQIQLPHASEPFVKFWCASQFRPGIGESHFPFRKCAGIVLAVALMEF